MKLLPITEIGLACQALLNGKAAITHLEAPTSAGKSYILGKGLCRASYLFESEAKSESRVAVANRWRQSKRMAQLFGEDSSDPHREESFNRILDAFEKNAFVFLYMGKQKTYLEKFESESEGCVRIRSIGDFCVEGPNAIENYLKISKTLLTQVCDLSVPELQFFDSERSFPYQKRGGVRKNHKDFLAETSAALDAADKRIRELLTQVSLQFEPQDKAKKLEDLAKARLEAYKCVMEVLKQATRMEFNGLNEGYFSEDPRYQALFDLFLPLVRGLNNPRIYTCTVDKCFALGDTCQVPLKIRNLKRHPDLKGTVVTPGVSNLMELLKHYYPEKHVVHIIEEEELSHATILERLKKTLIKENDSSTKRFSLSELHSTYSNFFSLGSLVSQSSTDPQANEAERLVLENLTKLVGNQNVKAEKEHWARLAEICREHRRKIGLEDLDKEAIYLESAARVRDVLQAYNKELHWSLEQTESVLRHVLEFNDYTEKPFEKSLAGDFGFFSAKLRAHRVVLTQYAKMSNRLTDSASAFEQFKAILSFFYRSQEKGLAMRSDLYEFYAKEFQSIFFSPQMTLINTEFLKKFALRKMQSQQWLEVVRIKEVRVSDQYISLADYLMFSLAVISSLNVLVNNVNLSESETSVNENRNKLLFNELKDYLSTARGLGLALEEDVLLDDENYEDKMLSESYIFEDTKHLLEFRSSYENTDWGHQDYCQVLLDLARIEGTPEIHLRSALAKEPELIINPKYKADKKQDALLLTQQPLDPQDERFVVRPIRNMTILVSATSGIISPMYNFDRKYMQTWSEGSEIEFIPTHPSTYRYYEWYRKTRGADRPMRANLFSDLFTEQATASDLDLNADQALILQALWEVAKTMPLRFDPQAPQASLFSVEPKEQVLFYEAVGKKKQAELLRALAVALKCLSSAKEHALSLSQTSANLKRVFQYYACIKKYAIPGLGGPCAWVCSGFEEFDKTWFARLKEAKEVVFDPRRIEKGSPLSSEFLSQARPLKFAFVDAAFLQEAQKSGGSANAEGLAGASIQVKGTGEQLDLEAQLVSQSPELEGLQKHYDITDQNLAILTTYGTYAQGLNADAVYFEDSKLHSVDPRYMVLTLAPFYDGIFNTPVDDTAALSLMKIMIGLTHLYQKDPKALSDYQVKDVLRLTQKFYPEFSNRYGIDKAQHAISQALGRPDRMRLRYPELDCWIDPECLVILKLFYLRHGHKKKSLTYLQSEYLKLADRVDLDRLFCLPSSVCTAPTVFGWIERQMFHFEAYRSTIHTLLVKAKEKNELEAQLLYDQIRQCLTYKGARDAQLAVEGLDSSCLGISSKQWALFAQSLVEMGFSEGLGLSRVQDLHKTTRDVRHHFDINEQAWHIYESRAIKSDTMILCPSRYSLRSQSVDQAFGALRQVADSVDVNVFSQFLKETQGLNSLPKYPDFVIQPWAQRYLMRAKFSEDFLAWVVRTKIIPKLERMGLKKPEILSAQRINELGIYEKADLFVQGFNSAGESVLVCLDSKYWSLNYSNPDSVETQESRLAKSLPVVRKAAAKLQIDWVYYCVINLLGSMQAPLREVSPFELDDDSMPMARASVTYTSLAAIKRQDKKIEVQVHLESLLSVFLNGGLNL